jgi:hypothetical protein
MKKANGMAQSKIVRFVFTQQAHLRISSKLLKREVGVSIYKINPCVINGVYGYRIFINGNPTWFFPTKEDAEKTVERLNNNDYSFRVGDIVRCALFGEGTVEQVTDGPFPILVQFYGENRGMLRTYTIDGRTEVRAKPSLFHYVFAPRITIDKL